MAKKLPEWAKPGTPVALYYRRTFADASVVLTTIERVTTTQVITADGRRWSDRSYTDEPNLRQVGNDPYSGAQLLPADSPLVREAHAAQKLSLAEGEVHTAFEALRRDRKNPERAHALIEKAAAYAALLEDGRP